MTNNIYCLLVSNIKYYLGVATKPIEHLIFRRGRPRTKTFETDTKIVYYTTMQCWFCTTNFLFSRIFCLTLFIDAIKPKVEKKKIIKVSIQSLFYFIGNSLGEGSNFLPVFGFLAACKTLFKRYEKKSYKNTWSLLLYLKIQILFDKYIFFVYYISSTQIANNVNIIMPKEHLNPIFCLNRWSKKKHISFIMIDLTI